MIPLPRTRSPRPVPLPHREAGRARLSGLTGCHFLHRNRVGLTTGIFTPGARLSMMARSRTRSTQRPDIRLHPISLGPDHDSLARQPGGVHIPLSGDAVTFSNYRLRSLTLRAVVPADVRYEDQRDTNVDNGPSGALEVNRNKRIEQERYQDECQ